MYTFIYQNTVNHDWFKADVHSSGISSTYIRIGFEIDAKAQKGEYRYFLIPHTDGVIKVVNNKIYVDGQEIIPLCSGLLLYGEYNHTEQQYNKETEFIQYGG